MMGNRKTDGEKLTEPLHRFYEFRPALAACIDRTIRRRLAEAYALGWRQAVERQGKEYANPYRGRRKK